MRKLTCVFEHASVDDSKIVTQPNFVNVLIPPKCPFLFKHAKCPKKMDYEGV